MYLTSRCQVSCDEVAEVGLELVCGGQIRVVQLADGSLIPLGDATGIGRIPQVVLKIHGDFSDLVTIFIKPVADFLVLVFGVAFMQEGVAEPVEVGVRHVVQQERIVLVDLVGELAGGDVVDIRVCPGVVAEQVPALAPDVEDGVGVGVFVRGAVDETVDLRDVVCVERADDVGCELYARDAAGQVVVSGQVVKRDGELLGGCKLAEKSYKEKAENTTKHGSILLTGCGLRAVRLGCAP